MVESIRVQVEGKQIKRGILRDFPTDYKDRFGRKVTVPFDVVSVKRDGFAESFSLERKANGVSVRIGNPNVMLPLGPHDYEITYRTNFQLGFFEDHDELYWNVNGNGWTFAMDEVAAGVSVHPDLTADQIKVEAYTGPFGAKGRDYTAETVNGGASFRTTRRLAAGEGLTIVVMFPKGYIAAPSFRDRFDRWLKDNLGEAIGAAGLLVLFAFLYWRWSVVGRDPREGPLFPRYEAPAGLGPGAVRFLDRRSYDDRCFAAALLGLAQRGFLHIREHGGAFEIRRTGAKVAYLPGDAYIGSMVPEKDAIDLGFGYEPKVQFARAGLEKALAAQILGPLYSANRGAIFFAILMGAATLLAMHALDAALFSMLIAGALVMAALVAGWKLLPAYTAEGRKRMDEIDGLRQYLTVGEKDELMRHKRPPRTGEEFAKFLPYAVALDVEKTWADAFAKVLSAAGLAAATSGYYSSTTTEHGSSFGSAGSFTDSVTGMGSAISAASTPPGSSSGSSGGSDFGGSSSSSSSGGGSSGGGGGGGGGSGW